MVVNKKAENVVEMARNVEILLECGCERKRIERKAMQCGIGVFFVRDALKKER